MPCGKHPVRTRAGPQLFLKGGSCLLNKKLSWLIEPGARVYLLFSVLCALVSAFFSPFVGIAEGVIVVLLYLYLRMSSTRRKREIIRYIESMSSNVETASKGTMINSPLPIVIFSPDSEEIIWSNQRFLSLTGDRDHLFDVKLSSLVPEFDPQWLMEGRSMCPEPVSVRDHQYLVYGNLVRNGKGADNNYMGITYWVDITGYAKLEQLYSSSRPMAAILQLDNYEELMKGLDESARSALISEINKRISQWAEVSQGILCRYDRDHYLLLFEAQYLAAFQQGKFAILDSAREIHNATGIPATLSIGIGQDAPSFQDLFNYATLSLEMALSRGGDQVVVKDRYNFQFFGGRTRETEKRTKVKSRVIANALSELLGDASQVLVMGHKFPDLDSIGAAVGVCAIARKWNLPAFVIRETTASPADNLISRMSELPEYRSAFLSAEDALLLVSARTILVVVDTNRPEQVISQPLLEACQRIVVIDHHRRAASYIANATLNFHEPYASSTGELVTELIQYIMAPSDLLRPEAEAIMAGIMLDTKNFTMRTGGRTFDAAAFLRRAGADTSTVNKLFQNDFGNTLAKYGIIQSAKLYRGSIAIAVVDHTVSRVSAAQAADELLNIAGISVSFVLFPEGDTIIVSARSSSDANVQVILEQLGGGGNAATAGAQISGRSLEEVSQDLIRAIDRYYEES